VIGFRGKRWTARMSFEQAVTRGDPLSALRAAAVNGALWAIGSSWATGIREITRLILPSDTLEAVLAETLAIVVTTAIGVSVALFVGKACRRRRRDFAAPPKPRPPLALTRVETRRSTDAP
jgi:hypothetical protein